MTSATVPAPISAAELRTLGDVGRAMLVWLRRNVPTTVLFALIGAASAWLMNVYVIAQAGGVNDTAGTVGTSKGNIGTGMLFWMLASSVVFGVGGYWRSVGTERFKRDVRAFPGTVAATVRTAGVHALGALLWGFAVALLASTLVAPSIAGVLGVGVALSIQSVLGRIASGLLMRVWSTVTTRLAPQRAAKPPPLAAMTVGLLGGAAALVLAFLVTSSTTKLILALAAVAAAVLLPRLRGRGSVALLFIVATALGLVILGFASEARADDGGPGDGCPATFGDWLNCPGTEKVLTSAGLGGLAGGIGAGLGTALGSALGGLPSPPTGRPGPDTGPEPGAGPEPGPGFHPLVDGDGNPLLYFDPDAPSVGGKPGQVWWGGKWLDPNSAEFGDSYRGEVGDTQRRNARWDSELAESAARSRVLEEEQEAKIRAEQAAEKAKNDLERHAIEQYGELLKDFEGLRARESYNNLLESINNEHVVSFREDGTMVSSDNRSYLFGKDGRIDPTAVGRARGALFRLVETNALHPDSELRPNSWLEDAGNTAIYTATEAPPILAMIAARAGLASVTQGISEVAIQSYGMASAMEKSTAPFGTAGLLAGMSYLAEQNLPMNVVTKLGHGEMFDVSDVLLDTATVGFHVAQVRAGGSQLPGVFGAVESAAVASRGGITPSQYLAQGLVATWHNVDLQIRPMSEFVIEGGAPKPGNLSAKTLKPGDLPFYPGQELGGLSGTEPVLPPHPTPAHEAQFERLKYEYETKTKPAVDKMVEEGLAVRDPNGQLRTPDGRPFTGDPDPLAHVEAGTDNLVAVEKQRAVTADLLRWKKWTGTQHGPARGPEVGYVDVVRARGGTPADIAKAEADVKGWVESWGRKPGVTIRPGQPSVHADLDPAPDEPAVPTDADPASAGRGAYRSDDYRKLLEDPYLLQGGAP